jgi:hypothetical protein
MIDYVTLETSKSADSGAGLAVIAADFITAPPSIDERDSPVWIMSQHVLLNVGCVQALLGYAVAIKHHSVAIFKNEFAFILGG